MRSTLESINHGPRLGHRMLARLSPNAPTINNLTPGVGVDEGKAIVVLKDSHAPRRFARDTIITIRPISEGSAVTVRSDEGRSALLPSRRRKPTIDISINTAEARQDPQAFEEQATEKYVSEAVKFSHRLQHRLKRQFIAAWAGLGAVSGALRTGFYFLVGQQIPKLFDIQLPVNLPIIGNHLTPGWFAAYMVGLLGVAVAHVGLATRHEKKFNRLTQEVHQKAEGMGTIFHLKRTAQ